MADQKRAYPAREPEGSQPRFPEEGVPAVPVVGNEGQAEDPPDQVGTKNAERPGRPSTADAPPSTDPR